MSRRSELLSPENTEVGQFNGVMVRTSMGIDFKNSSETYEAHVRSLVNAGYGQRDSEKKDREGRIIRMSGNRVEYVREMKSPANGLVSVNDMERPGTPVVYVAKTISTTPISPTPCSQSESPAFFALTKENLEKLRNEGKSSKNFFDGMPKSAEVEFNS